MGGGDGDALASAVEISIVDDGPIGIPDREDVSTAILSSLFFDKKCSDCIGRRGRRRRRPWDGVQSLALLPVALELTRPECRKLPP